MERFLSAALLGARTRRNLTQDAVALRAYGDARGGHISVLEAGEAPMLEATFAKVCGGMGLAPREALLEELIARGIGPDEAGPCPASLGIALRSAKHRRGDLLGEVGLFAHVLRLGRQRRGLTQAAIGARLSRDRSAVAIWEHAANLSEATLELGASALWTTVPALLAEVLALTPEEVAHEADDRLERDKAMDALRGKFCARVEGPRGMGLARAAVAATGISETRISRFRAGEALSEANAEKLAAWLEIVKPVDQERLRTRATRAMAKRARPSTVSRTAFDRFLAGERVQEDVARRIEAWATP